MSASAAAVATQPAPVTPAERKAAEDLVKKAKVQLVVNHPFFAQLVLNRPITISDKISTAMVTPRGHITVGTRFAAGLTVQQGVFLLAHEASHYAFLHPLRCGARDRRKWNIAGDAVINDILVSSNVGEFIPGGVNMPGSKDKTSEKVYDELPDNKGGKGGKGDQSSPGYEPGEGWDDLASDDEVGQLDESTIREIEENARIELAQAAQVAKQRGTMPAGLEGLIDSIINPKTPWHILLERYMTRMVKADYSFRRPSRRMVTHGFYLPSADRVPQMGAVVIVRDTSGSCMDATSQQHFLGHINSILEKCNPEKVYVLDVDAAVHQVQELTIDDLPLQAAKMSTKGGGGTSFKPPFRWVEKHNVEPEVFIYLTDMYGDFPERAPEYPVVWLSTTEMKEAPFGDVIQYEVTEGR